MAGKRKTPPEGANDDGYPGGEPPPAKLRVLAELVDQITSKLGKDRTTILVLAGLAVVKGANEGWVLVFAGLVIAALLLLGRMGWLK